MRLIILAAGYGGRLSPATDATPKALLDLGGGKTILDLQLESAKAADINDVRIVTGFRSEDIERKLAERADLGLDADWLYNPFFRVTNNLVSLWTARPAMTEDFVMLNGDDVFNPSILRQLLATEADLVAVIDRKSVYDADDTKIVTEGERIARIGKDIPTDESNAEWIGMCAVRGQARVSLVRIMDELIRDASLRDGPYGYLPMLQRVIDSGVEFRFMEIEPTAWAEVDYQMDLDFVRANLTRFIE